VGDLSVKPRLFNHKQYNPILTVVIRIIAERMCHSVNPIRFTMVVISGLAINRPHSRPLR